MSDLDFGIILTIVGMTGTLVSLWVLSLLLSALKKAFPLEAESSTPAPTARRES